MGLVDPAVADCDDVLSSVDVIAPGQLHDQVLVRRGDGEEVEGVEALDRGKRVALIRRSTMR